MHSSARLDSLGSSREAAFLAVAAMGLEAPRPVRAKLGGCCGGRAGPGLAGGEADRYLKRPTFRPGRSLPCGLIPLCGARGKFKSPRRLNMEKLGGRFTTLHLAKGRPGQATLISGPACRPAGPSIEANVLPGLALARCLSAAKSKPFSKPRISWHLASSYLILRPGDQTATTTTSLPTSRTWRT